MCYSNPKYNNFESSKYSNLKISLQMGPFVDRRNKSLTEKDKNTVAVTYETQHEAVLLMIAKALEGYDNLIDFCKPRKCIIQK